MGTFETGEGSWADGQCEGIWSFLRLKVTMVAHFLHLFFSKKNTAIFQCHLSFHILRSLQPQQKLGKLKALCLMGHQTNTYCCSVVSYDVVSPASSTRAEGWHHETQTQCSNHQCTLVTWLHACYHVPVAKYNLS